MLLLSLRAHGPPEQLAQLHQLWRGGGSLVGRRIRIEQHTQAILCLQEGVDALPGEQQLGGAH